MKPSRMFSFVKQTWNPVVGCSHHCIYCWARRQAKRQRNRCIKCYWFSPHIHKERLEPYFKPDSFKPNTLVFVGDMADLFCDGMDYDWIDDVLFAIEKNPKTIFFLETKNPERAIFSFDLPKENIIFSTTIETNKEGGELPIIEDWEYMDLSMAPNPEERLDILYNEVEDNLKGYRLHISIEPILDFDLLEFANTIKKIKPIRVSIGYDNYNHRLPEPSLQKTMRLIEILEMAGIEVERKTIRKAWWENESKQQ